MVSSGAGGGDGRRGRDWAAPRAQGEASQGEKAQGREAQPGLEGPCDIATDCMTLNKILPALKPVFLKSAIGMMSASS